MGPHLNGRQLKKEVARLLRQPDLEQTIEALLQYPARRVVNPLLSSFCSTDEVLKWRAVSGAGAVTAALAAEDPESARVIMRRLMWTLNDESGGIGWGSPEAMGDIMARSARLAGEFAAILISYADECGNYIEHPMLQRGVLWGLGRLARTRPETAAPAAGHLTAYLHAPDMVLRGLAAWTAAAVTCAPPASLIEALQADSGSLAIWEGDRLVAYTVGELAKAAWTRGRELA
jgi:hypothetical protein